jgi:hypothetical protein
MSPNVKIGNITFHMNVIQFKVLCHSHEADVNTKNDTEY